MVPGFQRRNTKLGQDTPEQPAHLLSRQAVTSSDDKYTLYVLYSLSLQCGIDSLKYIMYNV